MATLNTAPAESAQPFPPTLNYQVPQAYETAGVWAQGDRVIATDCAIFPPRCVRCNGNDQLKIKGGALTWCPPYAYLVLLLGVLPGALLLLLSQRKIKIRFSTCKQCRQKLFLRQLVTGGLVFLALACFVVGALFTGYIALVGVVVLIAAIIYGVVMTRTYVVTKIKNDTATLKGLGEAFVASLDQR